MGVIVPTTRNPTWTRDELILLLDFYLQHTPKIPSKASTEITALSKLLNRLQAKLGGEMKEKFRNINGVYLKLMNFRRFDPEYEGKGMTHGGKDEEVVWNLFAHDPLELKKVASAVRAFVSDDAELPLPTLEDAEESESEEGAILTRVHRFRERDSKIIKRKKDEVRERLGCLVCEVCGFEFGTTYGKHGDGFIECHHTKPVSQIKVGEKTKLSDLVLLCSNCHRMVHRKQPWLSLEQLAKFLKH